MLYREIEVEKYWDISVKDPRKKEKIKMAIETDKYIASIKKDGEYIRAIYDTDGEIWILGRGTNAKEVHNLDKHLVFIAEWLMREFKPGTCLIGELYVQGETSRAIRKYTGSLVPKSLKAQELCPPTYYIHDLWAIDGTDLMDTEYHERIQYIMYGNQFLNLGSGFERPWYVSGAEEITEYIAAALEKGEEGCVLVDSHSKPAPGKRTAWKTIKVKQEFADPIDAFFTGGYRLATRLYEGKDVEGWMYWENVKTGDKIQGELYRDYDMGKPIEPVTKPYFMGMPGSLEVGVFKGKEVFSLCYLSGLTDELRLKFINDKGSLSMRPITISGMMATDESIRHPKFLGFREDIPLEDCTWSKVFGGE